MYQVMKRKLLWRRHLTWVRNDSEAVKPPHFLREQPTVRVLYGQKSKITNSKSV